MYFANKDFLDRFPFFVPHLNQQPFKLTPGHLLPGWVRGGDSRGPHHVCRQVIILKNSGVSESEIDSLDMLDTPTSIAPGTLSRLKLLKSSPSFLFRKAALILFLVLAILEFI